MSTRSPFPCMPLKKATALLATIDIVINAILLTIVTIALIGFCLAKPSDPRYGITESQRTTGIITCMIAIVFDICQILLAWYLRRAAKEYNFSRCRKWLAITTLLFLFTMVNVGIRFAAGAPTVDLVFGILRLVYRLYVMIVVFCLMQEIKIEND